MRNSPIKTLYDEFNTIIANTIFRKKIFFISEIFTKKF